MGLDGQLVVNLLELLHNENRHVTGAAYSIVEKKVEAPDIIASLVALFRKDNVSARPVAETVSLPNSSSASPTSASSTSSA